MKCRQVPLLPTAGGEKVPEGRLRARPKLWQPKKARQQAAMRRPTARAVSTSSLRRRCSSDVFDSPEGLSAALRQALYIADEGLSTAVFLALKLNKPLLIEGVPG